MVPLSRLYTGKSSGAVTERELQMAESVRSEDAPAADPSSAAATRVTAARHATAVAFIGAGVVFASWVSRIPQVRSELKLTPADLGVVLLALAVGSLLALPAAAV